MIGAFQRPANIWLCLFSVLWIFVGFWFVASFALAGKFVQSGIMAVFPVAALGLWFQSRAAAWTLIVFALAGIVYALLSFGHVPVLRLITRILWASWGIYLLAEYLQGDAET